MAVRPPVAAAPARFPVSLPLAFATRCARRMHVCARARVLPGPRADGALKRCLRRMRVREGARLAQYGVLLRLA
jgi:hypothetical protein